MSGPAVFGLGLRDTALISLFFSLIGAAPVAWIGTMGPKTGLRQMIQARYSYGKYLACIVVLFQLATLTGYCVIFTIVSGQTLAALSHGDMSLEVGIAIIALLSMVVSFMGCRVLHVFETYAWIPTLFALLSVLGISGSKLSLQAQQSSPSARTVITFGSIIFSLALSWIAVVSDFAVYISPAVSRKRTFAFVYLGYNIPSITLLVLGAAIGNCLGNIESWSVANDSYAVGRCPVRHGFTRRSFWSIRGGSASSVNFGHHHQHALRSVSEPTRGSASTTTLAHSAMSVLCAHHRHRDRSLDSCSVDLLCFFRQFPRRHRLLDRRIQRRLDGRSDRQS